MKTPTTYLVIDFDWADKAEVGTYSTDGPDGEPDALVEAQTYTVRGPTVCDDSVEALDGFGYVMAQDAVRTHRLRSRRDWFVYTHDARELQAGPAALAYIASRAKLGNGWTIEVASGEYNDPAAVAA